MKIIPFYNRDDNPISHDRLKELANKRLSEDMLSPKSEAVWSCISTGEVKSVARQSWS